YERTRTRVLQLAIGEGLITLLAAIVSVYVLLRRLLGSVYRLTRTARDIGLRGELDVRLGDQRTGDEVGEMGATFDAMIDKIDIAMSVQRRLLADVSHQLRTPLTVMRGHLEVMCRGPLDDPAEARATVGVVVDQLDHMQALVERLLLLGRSLEVDFAELVPVDLRAMLADIADAAEVLAPRRWRVGPIPDVVLRADLDKLRGAVLNLIDNAVKATQPGDTIRLSATLEGGAGEAFVDILVDDSGPGIPPEERDRVLGRFSRPSAGDSHGTGLGLAIVEAVARAHGGRASVGDSPLGGCRVTIRLPLLDAERYPALVEGT
ncbi:MAG: sensor histidine kinase, partial [Acidimicrobiales bacterium]